MYRFLILFLLCSLPGKLNCQNKVLIPELAGNYKGDIKKDLAHGFGEAEGVDYYKGEFRKGLPHGKGSYIWSDGQKYSGNWKKGIKDGYGKLIFKFNGKDTTLEGYWFKDIFLGDKKSPDPNYDILNDLGVLRSYFQQLNTFDYKVVIKFKAEGRYPSDIFLQSSSGDYTITRDEIIYEHVEFPFTLNISYKIENHFRSNLNYCRFKFVINKKGYWKVKLFN